MTELLRGVVADTNEGAEPASPRPLRIRASGRLDPDAAQWTRPLPPLLWRRLDDEQRQAHERAVETYAEAAAKARELAAKARAQATEDEHLLRKAVSEGGKVPKPRAVAAEQAAEEAQRAADMAGRLVLESGGALAEPLSDDDVKAAVTEAKAEAAEIVAAIPELVDRLLEELRAAGRLGAEAQWAGRLVERRIQGPWTSSTTPLTHRLASAAEAAALLRAHVLAEVEERDRKATPVEHRAPPGAPPPGHGGFAISPIDPAR